MRQKFPSLSALRAFEAAARHMSFRKAAEDLNVTHSAISHQVKTLEEQLGVVLFIRTARTVELTEEGRFLSPILEDSFGKISAGIKFLTSSSEPDELSIQVYITVAMRWLVPRLPAYQKRVPELKIRLVTSYLDWEFDRQNVDVAILLTRKQQADLYYVDLFPAHLTPVCSPELANGKNPVQQPSDLLAHDLLGIFTSPDDWPVWFDAMGIQTGNLKYGPAFDSYVMALEAAERGQGVAMLNGPFATEDIQKGKLIAPFGDGVPNPARWQLVYRKEHRTDRRIRRFQDWLLNQIEEEKNG